MEEIKPDELPGRAGHAHYNPVTVSTNEAVGTAFLGLLSLILLVALLRCQGRNRALLERLGQMGPAG